MSEFGFFKMAAAAGLEFQRAQSLLTTDREASIGILHSIGEASPPSAGRERAAAGGWGRDVRGPGRVGLEPLLTHCGRL